MEQCIYAFIHGISCNRSSPLEGVVVHVLAINKTIGVQFVLDLTLLTLLTFHPSPFSCTDGSEEEEAFGEAAPAD